MRKQVDFDVRVLPLGNGSNGSMTHEQVAQWVRENYIQKTSDDGSYWEVFQLNVNQVSAGVIFLQVALLKYKDAESKSAK